MGHKMANLSDIAMSHRKGEEEACPAYQADTGKKRRDMKTWLVAAITAVISMIAMSIPDFRSLLHSVFHMKI